MRGVRGESVELICDYCGKKFMRKTYMLSKSGKYFCSQACVGKSIGNLNLRNRWKQETSRRAKKIELTCDYCEITFWRKIFPCTVNGSAKHYCSRECVDMSKRKEGQAYWEDRVCQYCEITFHVRKSESKHFCSVKCAVRWRAAHGLCFNAGTFKKGHVVPAKQCLNQSRKMKGHIFPESWRENKRKRYAERVIADPNYREIFVQSGQKGFIASMKSFNRLRKEGIPNKCEEVLLNMLRELYSNEYEYNYGQYVIAGKFPDFVNNESRKLIEVFGEKFHKPGEEAEKIELYNGAGWDCLVIWAKQLQDRIKIKTKVMEFMAK